MAASPVLLVDVLQRTQLVLAVVLAVTVTALLLTWGFERPKSASAKETGPDETTKQAGGKAPPIPQAGPLARPRSLQQVGVPTDDGLSRGRKGTCRSRSK